MKTISQFRMGKLNPNSIGRILNSVFFKVDKGVLNKAVLLSLWLIPFHASSQKCRCEIAPHTISASIDLIFEKPDDAKKSIQKLAKSDDPFCSSLGLLMEIRVSLNEEKLEGLEKKFNELKQSLKKTTCKDSLELNYNRYYAEFYFWEGKFGDALNYTQKYQQVAGKLKDYKVQFNGLRNMAMLLNRMDQPVDGIKYSDQAFSLLKKHQKLFDSRDIHMLAGNYLWYYQDYDSIRFKENCEYLTLLGIEKANTVKDYASLSRLFSLQAALYAHSGNYSEALTLTGSAINYSRMSGHTGATVPNLYRDFASYSLKLGKVDLARSYMDSCYIYYKSEGGPGLGNYLELSYLIEKKAANHAKALDYFERLSSYKDSVKSTEQLELINEYEQKYNKAENELKIQKLAADKKELNQQKKIDKLQIRSLIGIVAAIVFGLVVIVVYFKRSQEKAKLKINETEQRLNRSRINPHFFFNALTTLQGLAVRENDGKKIALNLFKFSSLMRKTLESSYNDFVTVDQEIEFMNQYIELQKLKDPERFDFEVKIDQEMESDAILLPSMLIQPFLENSIEHGFKDINYKGVLELSMKNDNQKLYITIKDNGAGIKEKDTVNKHISRATQITRDRLYLLQKDKKGDASFEVKENPAGGVLVELILPLIYK